MNFDLPKNAGFRVWGDINGVKERGYAQFSQDPSNPVGCSTSFRPRVRSVFKEGRT